MVSQPDNRPLPTHVWDRERAAREIAGGDAFEQAVLRVMQRRAQRSVIRRFLHWCRSRALPVPARQDRATNALRDAALRRDPRGDA